jgi:predicted esterase
MFAPFRRGSGRAFVSHGNNDGVLSFSNTRDAIVPEIQALGTEVNFVEFTGGHSIPEAVARQALIYAFGLGIE